MSLGRPWKRIFGLGLGFWFAQLQTQNEDVVGQWKEYLEEIRDPINTSSQQEVGSEDF